jgi:hypothetical protein
VLRKIFGLKREEITGEILHSQQLRDLYCSPNIIWVIKSRIMKWWHIWHALGEKRNAYRVVVGKPEGKRPLGDPDADGRIILRCMLRK